jgi:hypothetical protein
VALTLAAGISSFLSVLRYGFEEIMALMSLPEEQVSMMMGLGRWDGWPMALATALAWGSFLAYLVSLRAYFDPTAAETDD